MMIRDISVAVVIAVGFFVGTIIVSAGGEHLDRAMGWADGATVFLVAVSIFVGAFAVMFWRVERS